MQSMLINGSPSPHGFASHIWELARELLIERGVEVDALRLADMQIGDCKGCMSCLATGVCAIEDDMAGIIERMRAADGFVVISSVRNGLTTACFKRFYERISYTLGFPLELDGKQTLAIACVGMMGGKAINRKFLGLQDIMHTRLSGYLFFRTGIAKKRQDWESCRTRLQPAIDRFVSDLAVRRRKNLPNRLGNGFDRWVLAKSMLLKNPAFYANVIRHWQAKGYLKN
jgi:multimeric flavodoxin WrbA